MNRLVSTLLVLGFLLGSTPLLPASADDSPVPEKMAAQYKVRLDNSKEQIDLGLTKGWLKPAKAEELKKELAAAYALESDVKAKGYPKDATVELEKAVTLLNQHVTSAAASK